MNNNKKPSKQSKKSNKSKKPKQSKPKPINRLLRPSILKSSPSIFTMNV
jgi:hypothetical protein